MKKPIDSDVQMCSLITNGKPTQETIKGYTEEGWKIIYSAMAKLYDPYAMPTDIITFFAKPINKESLDNYMKDMEERESAN